MAGQDFAAMNKLVNQLYARQDAEPFRDPVDWKSLGLFDYPQIIKKPMDLGSVKRKLEGKEYSSVRDAAEDVRQIWKNCMTYNADGSDFYVLAQTLSKKFEDKYAKMVVPESEGQGGGSAAAKPTQEEKRHFAKSLYKITKEQLGKILMDLDTHCPEALTKNIVEDEIEIAVDKISPEMFHSIVDYIRSCNDESSGTGRKKKTASNKAKKARVS